MQKWENSQQNTQTYQTWVGESDFDGFRTLWRHNYDSSKIRKSLFYVFYGFIISSLTKLRSEIPILAISGPYDVIIMTHRKFWNLNHRYKMALLYSFRLNFGQGIRLWQFPVHMTSSFIFSNSYLGSLSTKNQQRGVYFHHFHWIDLYIWIRKPPLNWIAFVAWFFRLFSFLHRSFCPVTVWSFWNP